jgi:hypothetical protein
MEKKGTDPNIYFKKSTLSKLICKQLPTTGVLKTSGPNHENTITIV